MVCSVMAVVIVWVMTRIYWRIIWMIRVIRRIIWVVAAPAPVWVPGVTPVIWVVAPVRSPCRIPERIPERVPIAETDSEAERYGYVTLGRHFFNHINGIDCAFVIVFWGVFLVNCGSLYVIVTLFGLHCAGIEIAVI